MSKAKWYLSAVLVAGGIGAMFAFKARETDFVYVPEQGAPANTTLCTSQLFGLTTAGVTTFTIKGTSNSALPCAIIGVREGE